MTDRYDNVYEVDEAPPPPTPGARLGAAGSMLLGALLCVVVVVGIGYWLADLGGREAESLPVFRAQISPAKTRPEDPGGAETPYQNIRSYEVAAGGTLESTDTELAPKPEAPTAEDVAMGELRPEPSAPARQAPAAAERATAADRDPVAAPTPLPGFEPEPADAPVTALAPSVSPPVPSRPRDIAGQTAATSQQAIDQAAQLAARAAISPVQIQLGAFTDRAYTEAEWRRIAAANNDILAGRALAIQSTVAGNTKYYRLRVGPFRDRNEAKSVCEALKARGQDCIVAVNS